MRGASRARGRRYRRWIFQTKPLSAMIGNRLHSLTVTTTVLLAVMVVAAFSSCSREDNVKGVRFKAHSTGFMDPSLTKTTYTGEKSGGVERIDWTSGDLIRIVSDEAYVMDEPTRNYSDFRVDSFTNTDAVSTAVILPATDPNSLQWGSGKHTFWAMYPSPATVGLSGADLAADGTMTFTIPSTQTIEHKSETNIWLPDMTLAPLFAKKTVGAPTSSVPLTFSPQYTAYSITIGKGSLERVELASFTLSAETGNLAGEFTTSAPGSASVTSGTQEIDIDLSGIVLDEDMPTFTFSILALPEEVSGVKILFKGDFNGSGDLSQQCSLRLRDKDKNDITFIPYMKYNISGLAFPEILEATIEDTIIWNHMVEIMDSYSWWIMAGLDSMDWLSGQDSGLRAATLADSFDYWLETTGSLDYLTWLSNHDTGSRLASLMDNFDWWLSNDIADDIAWDRLQSISISDYSDAYLWPGERIKRTLTVTGLTGGAFTDADVAWYAVPTQGVVQINFHTGEIVGYGPGEADIHALVTPHDGSSPMTASFKVFVNRPTGVSVSAEAASFSAGATQTLTATVTHTGYGTVTTFPADLLTWTSDNTAAVTLSDAQAQPSAGEAAATATAVAAGTSTITVAVSEKYAHNIHGTVSLTVE